MGLWSHFPQRMRAGVPELVCVKLSEAPFQIDRHTHGTSLGSVDLGIVAPSTPALPSTTGADQRPLRQAIIGGRYGWLAGKPSLQVGSATPVLVGRGQFLAGPWYVPSSPVFQGHRSHRSLQLFFPHLPFLPCLSLPFCCASHCSFPLHMLSRCRLLMLCIPHPVPFWTVDHFSGKSPVGSRGSDPL